MRAADDRSLLNATTWSSVEPGQSLNGLRGRYLQVQLKLTAVEATSTPAVQALTVAAIAPPTIAVHQPANQAVFAAREKIVVSGTALATTQVGPGSTTISNHITAVLINGRAVNVVDAAGNFFEEIDILTGENRLEVVALDAYGQLATETVTVTGTQDSEGISENLLFDVSPSFEAEYARTSFDERTDLLYAQLAIHNVGQYGVDNPFLVGIRNISDVTVRVRDAAGFTKDGIPYYNFSPLVSTGTLAPDGITGFVDAMFYNPNRVPFTYDLVFLAKLNEPPAFTTVPQIEAIAGRAYTYDADATDPDGDSLIYSLPSAPAGMAVDRATGVITWIPGNDEVGTQVVVLCVEDGRGGSAEQHYALSVIEAPPNRPPTIISVPVTEATVATVTLDDALPIDLSAGHSVFFENTYGNGSSDPNIMPNWEISSDPDSITQQVNANASIYLTNVTLNNERIEGTWQVADTDAGGDDDFIGFVFGYQDKQHFYLFDWKKVDQNYGGGFAQAGMTVKVVDADSRLSIYDLWNTSGSAGRVRTLFHNTIPWENFTDYRFALDFRPGQFTITVRREGEILDSVTLTDSTYQTGEFGFYNYSQGQVNYRGFTRASIPRFNYTYDVEAIDPDSDGLTYTLVTPPTGMTIRPDTGLIRWAPSAEQAGSHDVTVAVSDGRGGTATQSFVIQVGLVLGNHAPVIVSDPITSATIGDTYTYDVDALDPDDDLLTYSLVSGPQEMTIDPATGLITWTTPSVDPATFQNQPAWQTAVGGPSNTTVFHFDGPTELGGRFTNDPAITPSYSSQGVDFLPFTGTSTYPVLGRNEGYQIPDPNRDGLLTNRSSRNSTLDGRAIQFDFNVPMNAVGVFTNNGDGGYMTVFDADMNPLAEVNVDSGVFGGVIVNQPIAHVKIVNTYNGDIVFGIWDLQFAYTLDTNTPVEVRVEDGRGGFDEQSFTIEVALAGTGEIHGTVFSEDQTNGTSTEPVMVPNYSFEDPDVPDGSWTFQDTPVPGWSLAINGYSGGVFDPGDAQYAGANGNTTPLPESADSYQCTFINLPFGGSGSITSATVATTEPDTLYSLTVAVGRRLDIRVDDVTVALLVNGQEAASNTISGQSLPNGTFTDLSTSFLSTTAGEPLQVRLSYTRQETNPESQVNFDNVRLSATTSLDVGLAGWTVYVDQNHNGRNDPGEPSTATDPQGRYAFTGLPGGTYAVREVPQPGWYQTVPAAGFHQVTLSDGQIASGLDFGNKVVSSAGNQNPTFTSTAPPDAAIGQLYRYSSSAFDLDADPLQFNLPVKPAGMAIDPTRGVVVWTPTADQVGVHDVLLRVQDGRGGVALQPFQIIVSAANTPPVITSQPPVGPAAEGLPFQCQVRAKTLTAIR